MITTMITNKTEAFLNRIKTKFKDQVNDSYQKKLQNALFHCCLTLTVKKTNNQPNVLNCDLKFTD